MVLVDDDPVNREVGEAILNRLGHHAAIATDGTSAVALARDQSFDVILMDLHMPDLDGVEAGGGRPRAVPAAPPPHTPRPRGGAGPGAPGGGRGGGGGPAPGPPPRPRIIAVTADASSSARERLAGAGILQMVSKPILINALREAIEDEPDVKPSAVQLSTDALIDQHFRVSAPARAPLPAQTARPGNR